MAMGSLSTYLHSVDIKDSFMHIAIHPALSASTGRRLIIVSALYGLLDGNDLIRNYELSMKDSLPTGMKVHTFWRHHELRDMLWK